MDPKDEVIQCPTLRAELEPRDSPFMWNNYHGGGFTSDQDRVLLQSVYFANRSSAGVHSQDRLELLSHMREVSFRADKQEPDTADM